MAMVIEASTDKREFFVYREMGGRRDYFCFYVDDDKSSWSQFKTLRARFISRTEAAAAIVELRQRQALRRRRRNAGLKTQDLRHGR